MDAPPVQRLLGAVRRRLWLGHFIAAARFALWGSAALLLLAGAAHLAARPVPIDALLAAIVLLWAAALTWAGLRRPSEGACALWADRHLGGASAYSTLLEMRHGAEAAPQTQAVRWLEQWATASVPEGRRLLAGRRDPARLVRPLFSLLVAAAIAGLVLTLPGLAPSSRPELAAPTAPGATDAPTPDAAALASTGLAGELASALRSAESRDAPDRGSMGRASAAGPGKNDNGTPSPMGERHGAPAKGGLAAITEMRPGEAVDATRKGRGAQAPGAGSGRDAGESRDDRADAGVSPVPERTMPAQRRESDTHESMIAKRADMDRAAIFDDALEPRAAATSPVEPPPAAATPPPAAKAMRLTPTEAAYVQAWMKTSAERR